MVQKVFPYTKTIIEMWQSTHIKEEKEAEFNPRELVVKKNSATS